MAMKIYKESEFSRVYPRHFEKLAEMAGLAKPMVRRRVPELAEKIIATLDKVPSINQTMQSIAALIRVRCEKALLRFQSR